MANMQDWTGEAISPNGGRRPETWPYNRTILPIPGRARRGHAFGQCQCDSNAHRVAPPHPRPSRTIRLPSPLSSPIRCIPPGLGTNSATAGLLAHGNPDATCPGILDCLPSQTKKVQWLASWAMEAERAAYSCGSSHRIATGRSRAEAHGVPYLPDYTGPSDPTLGPAHQIAQGRRPRPAIRRTYVIPARIDGEVGDAHPDFRLSCSAALQFELHHGR
jgi:hypothetical protein